MSSKKIVVRDFDLDRQFRTANDVQAAKVLARTIIDLAKKRETFTADDVWAVLEDKNQSHIDWTGQRFLTTKNNTIAFEPRILGTLMNTAVRLGLITNTGTYRKSALKVRHGRPVTVWESLAAVAA